MPGILRKLAAAVFVAALLMIGFPSAGSATVNGACQVTGTGSLTGATDLTTTAVWHLKNADEVTGSATYPEQTYVHVFAIVFGIPIPVYSSSGKDTKGSAGPFAVSDYSKYTRVFAAGGSSESCTGAVVIIVDDQSPFTNAVGLVSLALTAIGLIGLLFLLLMGRGRGGCGGIVLGAILGLMLGLGSALAAVEAGVIDPSNFAGLIVTGVGLLVGVVVAVFRGVGST
jgi:hypothetical protein